MAIKSGAGLARLMGWSPLAAFALASLVTLPVWAAPEFVTESARQIPVAAQVDVVVVGGSSADGAATLQTKEAGHSRCPNLFL